MTAESCTVVVEQLNDGNYRAKCQLFPDCEATAATEEEARRAVEQAMEYHLRQWFAAEEGKADPSIF